MTDKIALFFTKNEVLDVLDTLEDARHRYAILANLEEGSTMQSYRCERTNKGLDDLIHRFNMATSGLTNDPDGWYNG